MDAHDAVRVLERLTSLSLTTEDDVREEFVTPLLRLLGYDHARDEIRRAVALSTPYQSGTKRKEYIVPDYLAMANGRVHLAIDAKRPGTSSDQKASFDPSYVSQVHSYAAHREVQAPFFMLSDGDTTAVYETSALDFQPILSVPQSRLAEDFLGLARLVSKTEIANRLASHLTAAWNLEVRHRAVGFQPINLCVGDFDQDGLPEIAVALSENHIPVFSRDGELRADIETDGWVWWVTATGATAADEATLVAIQKDRQRLGLDGKILGIRGSDVIWEHSLPKAGSGFEELDRVVVDPSSGSLVFAVPCDDVVRSLSLRGELLWETQLDTDDSGSVLDLRFLRDGQSVVTTTRSRRQCQLVELDYRDGTQVRSLSLPFRGAQIVDLNREAEWLLVGNADGGEVAVVNWTVPEVVKIVEIPFVGSNPRLAFHAREQLLAIAGTHEVWCFPWQGPDSILTEVSWRSDAARGHINRLRWFDTPDGPALLASTCGMLAAPTPNGIYVFDSHGALTGQHSVPGRSHVDGQAGIRDARVAHLLGGDFPEVVAVADNSRLYVWSPR